MLIAQAPIPIPCSGISLFRLAHNGSFAPLPLPPLLHCFPNGWKHFDFMDDTAMPLLIKSDLGYKKRHPKSKIWILKYSKVAPRRLFIIITLPNREASGLERKGVGQWIILRAVATPDPQSIPSYFTLDTERKSRPLTRIGTLLLASLGLYPQVQFI